MDEVTKEVSIVVVTRFQETGQVKTEEWFDGKTGCDYHRVGAPAVLWYYPDGSLLQEMWYQNGAHYRPDGMPSTVRYNQKTRLPIGVHFHERSDGPTDIFYSATTGLVLSESWSLNGSRHRAGGLPAHREFDEKTGDCTFEQYFENSKLHRAPSSGPAWIERDPNTGHVTEFEYYEKGELLDIQSGFSPPEPGQL